MVGEFIKNNELLKSHFNTRYINSSSSRNINELGKASLKKLIIYTHILYQTISALIIFRPYLCYIALSAKGVAFYKDCVMILLFKLFCKKTVLHFHNKGVAKYQDRWIDDKLYKFVFRDSKVILLSNRLYRDISKYVNKQNVLICPNGIPIEAQNENIKAENSTLKLLFLSNMMKAKGVYDLLEACVILKQKSYNFRCDFVGKWADITEASFLNHVNECQIDDIVEAHGAKYGEDKSDYFNNTDIFIFPTFYENECFPLVLLEAMQNGLPIVTTNEGGIPDIVDDGITGFIVEKQNPELLANKIEELILKPELRKKMGEAGKQKFEKQYTLEHFERRMCEILEII